MTDGRPKYLYVSGMPLWFWGWNGRLVRLSDDVYAMEQHRMWGISMLGYSIPTRGFYAVKVRGRWIIVLDSPDSRGTVLARRCVPEPVQSLPIGTWNETFHIGRGYRPSLPIIPLAKFLTVMTFMMVWWAAVWSSSPVIESACQLLIDTASHIVGRGMVAVSNLSNYSNFTSLIHRCAHSKYLGIAVGIATYALYAI